jgi:hypothetical protein
LLVGPRSLSLIILTAFTLTLAMTACDDEPTSSGGTTTVPSPSPRPTGTAGPTPSPAPVTPTPRPAISPSPTAGRIDGTVAPQNFGGTDPVTIKSNPDPIQGNALLRDVRIGVHPEEGGWDRIVFEFAADLPPARVEYVRDAFACGSGMPVSLRGGAILAVRFEHAAAHTEAGQQTIARSVVPGPGETILEARQTCDFEGHVDWALGVKGRQRFKVTLLDAPRRVVIDIKQ